MLTQISLAILSTFDNDLNIALTRRNAKEITKLGLTQWNPRVFSRINMIVIASIEKSAQFIV